MWFHGCLWDRVSFSEFPAGEMKMNNFPFLTKTAEYEVDSVGFLLTIKKPRSYQCSECGPLCGAKGFSDQRKQIPLRTSLMMSEKEDCRERKDNVRADKEAGEILEKLSSLPLVPSLLTRQGSSIHFSLISGCCPSLTGPKCLSRPVMTMTSTLLSRSALGGGWQLWWVSTEADYVATFRGGGEVGQLISCSSQDPERRLFFTETGKFHKWQECGWRGEAGISNTSGRKREVDTEQQEKNGGKETDHPVTFMQLNLSHLTVHLVDSPDIC